MSDTLVLDDIAAWEEVAPFSCRLAPGRLAIILTPKDELNGDLVRLLLGLARAKLGRVRVFDREPASLNEREGQELRRRVGTVTAGGGLISNLKAWENLVLPVQFHRRMPAAELESAGTAALERVGYQGPRMALPGLMNVLQRKQVGLARALLLDPELMIYESLLNGLNRRERNALLEVARTFHHERKDRCSLFLSSDPGLPEQLPEAEVHYLTKGSLP